VVVERPEHLLTGVIRQDTGERAVLPELARFGRPAGEGLDDRIDAGVENFGPLVEIASSHAIGAVDGTPSIKVVTRLRQHLVRGDEELAQECLVEPQGALLLPRQGAFQSRYLASGNPTVRPDADEGDLAAVAQVNDVLS
jgi:hypothetical protein